jgi:uncharacterized lipoprotein YajG
MTAGSRGAAASAVLLALLGAGCGTAGLDVRYPEAGARAGMLAAAGPARVEIAPVVDRRRETGRIGRDEEQEDVVTSRPVADIVRDALALEARTNGFATASDPPDATLTAHVEEFWLDVVRGYRRTQYVGKVVIALAVTDAHTGDVLLSRRYLGTKRREVDKASDEVARDVMDAALARTMRGVATDPDLVAALARAHGRTSARSSSPPAIH